MRTILRDYVTEWPAYSDSSADASLGAGTGLGSDPVRLVLDSNVWLSLASHRSYIYQFFFGNRASIHAFKLYTSPQQLIAMQIRLVEKLRQPQPQAVAYISSIRTICETVYPRIRFSDDNTNNSTGYLEECALEAKAEVVITANKKLIKSKSCAGVSLIHPAQLLALKNYLRV